MKWLKRTAILLIPVTLLLLGGAWFGLLHTEPGARWVMAKLQDQLPGTLSFQSVSGDLSSGLKINKLDFSDESLVLRADRVSFSLDPEFFPLGIHIQTALIETLDLTLPDSQPDKETEAASLEDIISALDLPVTLAVTDSTISGLRISNASGEPPVAIDQVEIALELAENLNLSHFLVQQDTHHFKLVGTLGLAQPFAVTARASTRGDWLDTAGKSTEIDADLTGNLSDSLSLTLSSSNPGIEINGSLMQLMDQPRWQLDIRSDGLQWPPDQADYSINDLILTTQGWLDDYQLTAKGLLENFGDIDSLTFDTQGRGNLTQFEIAHLTLSGAPLALSASGSVEWQDELELTLDTVLEHLDPMPWLEDWPQQHPVSGRMEVRLDSSAIELPMLELVLDGTEFGLAGSSRFDLTSDQVVADLTWQEFHWPPGHPSPDISSPHGTIQLSGVLDDWNLSGNAVLQAPGVPEGVLHILANGNQTGASVQQVDGQVLGGLISGNGSVNWSDGFQWTAQVASNEIELERLVPEFPARINAELSARGDTRQSLIAVDVQRLTGLYRALPLAAQGQFRLEQGVPSFTEFTASLADSRVELNGTPYDQAGLAFSGESPKLDILHAEAAGAIRFNGQFSLHDDQPSILLNLEGQDLRWSEYRARSLTITERDRQSVTMQANLDIEATALMLAGQPLDQAKIGLSVGPLEQALMFEAQNGGIELSGSISGQSIGDASGFPDDGWSGMLDSLKFAQDDRLALNLSEPAAIEWSPSGGSLGEACLNVSTGTGKGICVQGEWAESDHLTASARFNQFPLSIIKPFLDTDLEFNQAVDGELTWSSKAGNPGTGVASIDISPGELRYADDFDSLLKTGPGRISFNIEQGRLSEGRFELPLYEMGGISIEVNIPDIRSGLGATLDGKIVAHIADLDVITLFVPIIDQAGGRLAANLDLKGNVGDPHFSGEITLSDGLIRHLESGLRLNDINLSGRVQNNDRANLTGSFGALEGSGELQADLDLTDFWAPSIKIDLQGDNLKLFDADDLTLVAAPDLRLSWKPGAVEIEGQIRIPSAHIAPKFIPSSTVSESPDLVIVAGAPSEAPNADEEKAKISIRGNLEITLGDKVEVDLDYTKAQLSGGANFTWKDELIPVANGQYHLVGQINVLGQRLEISQGTIGFPNVKADNPHLNIRAEREIFGNSEIRRAGVFVTGTLRRFALEPFTEPITNRERARTLLITGSDFNMEEGVGVVDIGTYIAPRVFVSYGIGVFEDESVFSVRYDLGKGWGVKATSGQRQTGLDMSYTIER